MENINTERHIKRVQELLEDVCKELNLRGIFHDQSKLEDPEKEMFDSATELKTLEYGSTEYKQALTELGPALKHHYKCNRHHPQHFKNGISDMTLIDLIEMFVDWKASSERHETGNIYNSIDINKDRFKMSDQLAKIFKKTAKHLGY